MTGKVVERIPKDWPRGIKRGKNSELFKAWQEYVEDSEIQDANYFSEVRRPFVVSFDGEPATISDEAAQNMLKNTQTILRRFSRLHLASDRNGWRLASSSDYKHRPPRIGFWRARISDN